MCNTIKNLSQKTLDILLEMSTYKYNKMCANLMSLQKSFLALHDAQAGSRTGDIHSSFELLSLGVPYLRKGPFTLPSCGVRKTVECGEKI